MLRMLLRFVVLSVVALAATWLAYRPGNLTLEWLGYHVELPLALAAVLAIVSLIVLVIIWALLRRLLQTPGAVTDYFRFRRTRRGHEALSAGMIAVSAGDIAAARRQAQIAARILPGEPLARLLQAETASLEGDARRIKDIYGEMLADPATELVALKGLFEAARRSGDAAAARRYAEQALKRNAGAAWASNAMLAIQSAESDWPAVSSTIEAQRKARLLDDETARKKRAVVLTAQALAAEVEVRWVDGTEPVRFAVEARSRLPRVVHDRVQNSILLAETVKVPGDRHVRVVLRRAADGTLFSQVIGNGRVDLADPEVAAVIDAAEARVREAGGL